MPVENPQNPLIFTILHSPSPGNCCQLPMDFRRSRQLRVIHSYPQIAHQSTAWNLRMISGIIPDFREFPRLFLKFLHRFFIFCGVLPCLGQLFTAEARLPGRPLHCGTSQTLDFFHRNCSSCGIFLPSGLCHPGFYRPEPFHFYPRARIFSTGTSHPVKRSRAPGPFYTGKALLPPVFLCAAPL